MPTGVSRFECRAQRSRSRVACACDNCSMTPPTCRTRTRRVARQFALQARVVGPRRRRRGRRGRGALPAGEHRPLRPATPTAAFGLAMEAVRDRRPVGATLVAGVAVAPARHRPLPGEQLLRGARPLPAGARDVPHHRSPGRRGQHPEHGRRHVPLDGRQRPGDRHLRVRRWPSTSRSGGCGCRGARCSATSPASGRRGRSTCRR